MKRTVALAALLIFGLAGASAGISVPALPAAAETAHMKHPDASAHDFVFKSDEGENLPLSDFSGRLVLVVNTATECGFSGQIGGLQTLSERYKDRGLVVLGVPSNDFGGQEPRTDGEIAGYCEATYGASFPMTAKTSVKGEAAHPFYKWAAAELDVTARPLWNFHKYLIGPDGRIVAWFATPTPPLSPDVTSEIERQLKQLHGG